MRPAFAKRYDTFTAQMEDAWLDDVRRTLVQDLVGTVVEIGAGTGKNLVHYGDGVDELFLTEPTAAMRDQLRVRVEASHRPFPVRVIDAVAERLPIPTDSVDTVVSTLVLCSVPSIDAAVAEVARVLRPGGRLRLVEHVTAPGRFEAAVQARLDPAWTWIEGSCHLDHDAVAALDRGGFDVSDLVTTRQSGMPPLFRTITRGTATLA